MIFIFQSVGV